jgi:hypothetical protein
LREEPLFWLLEAEIPAICYLALVDLMGLPEEDDRVQEARQAIMHEGLFRTFLQSRPRR